MNESFQKNEIFQQPSEETKETMNVHRNDITEPTPIEEADCKDISDAESASDQKKEKIEKEIISTAVDGVLSFFQVW